MVNQWDNVKDQVPAIILIEDIDAVFHGRENILGEDGGGLSFDCFLNCLSGIDTADGILLVITTNNVDVLDVALGIPKKDGKNENISTRPGRLDRAVELGPTDPIVRLTIAKRILSSCPQHVERMVVEGDGDMPAQFVERCAKLALEEYWSEVSEFAEPIKMFA